MGEEAGAEEPELTVLLQRLDFSDLDLVLVEGFRHIPFPKIELHRPSLGRPLLCVDDDTIIAVAVDETPDRPISLPRLDLNDPPGIVAFIMDYCARYQQSTPD